jgi:2-haloalkanoic acid dehalogenase type II
MREIQAIYFDFGGTLFSYRSMSSRNHQLMSEVADRFGADGSDRAAITRAYHSASGRAFADHGRQPYFLHRDLFSDIFRHFAAHLERRPAEAEIDWAYQAMRSMMIDSVELREDCMETLEQLRKAGLCLAIVSNIDDDVLQPMIDKVGLDGVLDHYWSSEEAQSCKPDPGFFHYALERTGHKPEEVLFVGDSPDHDIAGASPLGMRTALIIDEHSVPSSQDREDSGRPRADHEIEALSELLDLLELGTPGA